MPVPTSVEQYLAALPEDQRATLEQLRRTIRAAAPEATETIAYQIPTFKDRGRMLVSYAAFRNHCSFYPASTMVIERLGDELRPYLSGKATIRFQAGQPIPIELVKRIVAARLEENAAATAR